MATLYLNKDKSLICTILKNGKFSLSATTSNENNAKRLISNISDIIDVKRSFGKITVNLRGVPFAEVHRNGDIVYNNQLTAFETRLFAQGKNTDALPFDRTEKVETTLKTDLHTHFAGALTPELLIETGMGNGVKFNKALLDKIKIDYSLLTPDESGKYALEDIVKDKSNMQALIKSLKIDTSEQETFNRMEEIYAARGPFTKNPNMFIPILHSIAKDAQKDGVKYIELSLSSVISDVSQLKLLEENMPRIEAETGVKIRFLGALWRHSDKEWNADEVDRLKVTAQSPYVVGCDVMGHETNSTMDFYADIKELAKYAMEKDPNFVIRVHAGENPIFKANVRQVLLAVEEAHYELAQKTGRDMPYPQVRIGHGIYGFDEPAPYDEDPRTKDITTEQLCKQVNPIIEFNMSSNLSLNNINGLDIIPIKKYLDDGIRVVLGTDGKGIYSTDLSQEMLLAAQAGLTPADFEKIAETENTVIEKEAQRSEEHSNCDLDKVESDLKVCYSKGSPQYTAEVKARRDNDQRALEEELPKKIARVGAITDPRAVEKDLYGKRPIMITGSSTKHWPKISEINKLRLDVALDTLIHCIDPNKAYLVTGGTNHGVEREAHILANQYNKTENGNLMILGTLTKEAMEEETNSIEPDTITHAILPSLNGKIAEHWFDLPDTVLNVIEKEEGAVVAIGGGGIVSDIIQRSHNMGLDLKLMNNVEGASGDKAKELVGNYYEFSDGIELVKGLMASMGNVFKQGLTDEVLGSMTEQSYNRATKLQVKRAEEAKAKAEEVAKAAEEETKKLAVQQVETTKDVVQETKPVDETKDKHTENVKNVRLISLSPNEYPDIEVSCAVIKDMKAFVTDYLSSLKQNNISPRKAKKTSKVKACLGKVGEEVDTRPRVERDGKLYAIDETKNKVSVEGSMIVTNPDGEQYIVKPDAFQKKYNTTSTPGIYEPVATNSIDCIPINKDIVFTAPWNEEMCAIKGAILNVTDIDKVYAIQNAAFEATYTLEKNKVEKM